MSFKATKSAFSILKQKPPKKSLSLTTIDDVCKDDKKAKKLAKEESKKASSANTTPTGSLNSVKNFISKLTNTEKKQQKAELKHFKKMLRKSGGASMRGVNSPLVPSNVQLKALRPKGSSSNLSYQLPLKSDPTCVPALNGSLDIGELNSSQHGRKRPSSTVTPDGTVRGARPSPTHSTDSVASARGAPNRLMPPDQPPKRRKISRQDSATSISSRLDATTSRVNSTTSSRHDAAASVRKTCNMLERVEPLPTHPGEEQAGRPYMWESTQEAGKLFECLIHPVKPAKFFAELWERKPLLVKRHIPAYNDGWFSCQELDRILREERLIYGANIDITTYTGGVRETHNPAGRALAPVVWDYFQNGCSVRVLNPQTYSRNVWKLLSILQEYFCCCVGANTYLTPAGSQGFAPHYDDIEAFILQLEGKKHWRLYSPCSESNTLPRFSSSNLTQEEIGAPILDVVLEAGDLLYFPRGTIHQAQTLDDVHSLHITLSCCQRNTWGDLMMKLVPRALDLAIEEDVEFRRSLPRDYLHYMGVAFSDSTHGGRATFLRMVEQLMMKLVSHAPVDAACDQMSKTVLHQSLPPLLTEDEKRCSVFGSGERWDTARGGVCGAVQLESHTEVKLLRRGCVRLITEGDRVSVYHNLDNTRIYEQAHTSFLDIDSEIAPAVEMLLREYPQYMKIDNLPLPTTQERMEIAGALYDRGLLITREPLNPFSDSSAGEGERDTGAVDTLV